jgi:CHAT domain-containing protein
VEAACDGPLGPDDINVVAASCAGAWVVGQRTILVAATVLTAVVVGSGCRSGPPPERLFAEAEALRLVGEKEASRQAVAKYREAAAAWARQKDAGRAARANHGLGAAHRQLGALEDSLRAEEAALADALASGDRDLESDIRSDIGRTASLAADRDELFEAAYRQCEAALDLARQSASVRQAARALTCLGEVAYNRGDRATALGWYRQAETTSNRAGERQGEAEAILFQGSVHIDQSDLDAADQCLERATALFTALGDRRGTALTLVGRGRLLHRRRAFQDALNALHDALAILEPMGDAIWEGASLSGLADIYLNMGDPPRALEYLERALQRFETAGLKSFSADLLLSIGETRLAQGDDGGALTRFERALALARELDNRYWQAYALRFMGVAHLVLGEPTTAADYLARSLDVQQALDDPRFEALTRADLGEAQRRLGAYPRATSAFRDALALSRVAGDRVGEAQGRFGLARVSADLGDLDTARKHVDGALAIAGSVRTDVESRDLRASYFASVQHYHQFNVDLLMRLHRLRPGQGLAAAAFAASERARARSLLDSLTEVGIDLRAGLDPDLLRREQSLKRSFDDWGQRQRRADAWRDGADVRALAAEYRELQARDDRIQAEIRRRSPRYAALVRPRPVGLAEFQTEMLDDDTVLLEYALGDERSYLWAVSKREQASYELPRRAEIERLAHRVYDGLTTRLAARRSVGDRPGDVEQADLEFRENAARLSDMLLAPVAPQVAGKRLLVAADGVLQYLPFAALPLPGRPGDYVPVLVEHEVVSVPSASAVAVLRRETAGRRLPARAVVVLADPVFEADDPRLRRRRRVAGAPGGTPPRTGEAPSPPRLASTRLEAEAIAAAAPPGMVSRKLDFEASRATAMSDELAQYRIVHFATHGIVDNENPGLSGVILSRFDEDGRPQDGFLRLHDIYTLRLPAELVVLSACNTALGRQVSGEGIVGIVRGFMYAGAKRVVASLWKVDDDATGEMMGRFYVEMLQRHRSPAAALRQAQLALWRQDRWRPPFYWAAFVVQGEWQ